MSPRSDWNKNYLFHHVSRLKVLPIYARRPSITPMASDFCRMGENGVGPPPPYSPTIYTIPQGSGELRGMADLLLGAEGLDSLNQLKTLLGQVTTRLPLSKNNH